MRCFASITARVLAEIDRPSEPESARPDQGRQRRCPKGILRIPAFRRIAPSLRFISFAITDSGVRACEWALSWRTSSCVHRTLSTEIVRTIKRCSRRTSLWWPRPEPSPQLLCTRPRPPAGEPQLRRSYNVNIFVCDQRGGLFSPEFRPATVDDR